ncbi:CheR family methyltransferase, partial [Trichothermofontia sp.]
MRDVLLQQFVSLISETTGLQIRPQDRDLFAQKLQKRLQAVGKLTPEAYYHLLSENRKNTGHAEWRELLTLLTTTESYFFRDQGQFSLLRETLLPDLLDRKRTLGTQPGGNLDTKPSIRIWSAGCSTGEEAYSLAILLHEMIANWEDWHITILGTDINQNTLITAQRGIYSDWSFRHTDMHLRQTYFRPHRDGWEILPEIRRLVTFRYGNLVQDPFPSPHLGLYDFDLILCRNVFIYFDADAIQRVLHKFYATLLPNGYLITGHTELYGQQLSPFRVRSFPQSILYQRSPEPDLPVHLPPSRHQPAVWGQPNSQPVAPPVGLTPLPPIAIPQSTPLPHPPIHARLWGDVCNRGMCAVD